jgi:NADH-quinone oxidoreductase subunit N
MRIVELAPNAAFATALPGIGALTALVGAFFALRQLRLQRLLAYLSLSHAGLLIIGVGAWSALGRSPAAAASLLFYLGADALMSNGSFAFLKASGASTRGDLRGHAALRPGLTAAFAVLLFALAGIPPSGGFVAELLIFWQAISASLAVPIVLGAVAALLSLGVCLGLVRDLYFEESAGAAPVEGGAPARIAVLVCAIGTLALGLAPLLLRGLTGSVWR